MDVSTDVPVASSIKQVSLKILAMPWMLADGSLVC